MTPFVLGIVGASGSGKNTIADSVASLLGPDQVADVRLDDYHRFTREERAARGVTALNPVVHNTPLMQEHLLLLRQGKRIRNRTYDHADGTFGPIRTIEPKDVVLARGILGYPTDALRSLYHLAVFLHPEPELLFRWKLRRDVLSRGYTETEALKAITYHLLDSKQFVLPQAERADVVIRHLLPDPDAPDEEVRTSVLMRRRAAEVAREAGLLESLHVESRDDPLELLISCPPAVAADAVERLAGERFPADGVRDRMGIYLNEKGERRHQPQLALAELLVACLVQELRTADPLSPGEAR